MDNLIIENILSLENLAENVFFDKNFETSFNINEDDLSKIMDKKNDTQNRIDNLLEMAETISIEPLVFKVRLQELQNKLVEYKAEEIRLTKELSIAFEKENILNLTKQLVQQFKKIKDFKEKRDFVRTIISSITIEYAAGHVGPNGDRLYEVVIYFKINQSENYLIAKQLTLNRDGRKGGNGKAVTKVLFEKVSLTGVVFINEMDKQISEYGYINYNDAVKF